MKIVIEDAKKEDVDRLAEIYSSPDLHRMKDRALWYVNCYFDYHHIKIARVDGVIQGACFWRIEGEKVWGFGWIEDLWVEKEHRKKGLGEKLLRAALDEMKIFFEKDGIRMRRVALTTDMINKNARQLYEKLGFRNVANITDIYEEDKDSLFYVLVPKAIIPKREVN